MNATLKRFAWTALAVTMMAAGIGAQEYTVRTVDPQHSQGRIFLTSTAKSELEVNVGVARVSGTVEDKVGSSPTAFNFTIYPADQQGDKVNSNATVISFRSNRVEHADDLDGRIYRASGELTVTFPERIATYGPAESYSGPAYGPSQTYSVKREASFDFRPVQHGNADGAAGYTEWVATSTVTGRAFPALLQAVANTSWPEYVNDENCSNPGSSTGEDYSGAVCTGEVVATTPGSDSQCEIPSSTGEGYGGQVCGGAPLQTPTRAQQGSYTVLNVETNNQGGAVEADAVKLVVSLRLGEAEIALAGNAGK